MKVKKTVVSEFTGEVFESTKSYPDVFNDEGYLFWARRKQCRVFSEITLPEALSFADKGRLMNLVPHIEKNTNCLVKRTKQGYEPMEFKDFEKAFDLGTRQAKALLIKLIETGVLAQVIISTKNDSSVKYYVNPIYYHAGKRITVELYRLFSKWLDPHLNPWVKELLGGESDER